MNWFGGGDVAEGPYQALNASGQTMEIPMTNALNELGKTNQVYIKQRIAKCEVLTCNCFESRNRFDVYSGSTLIFKAHETTPCCLRQAQTCCPDCASFDFQFDYVGGGSDQEGVFKMQKACTPCTCCCINR